MDLHKATLNFVISTYIDKVFIQKQDFVLDLRESLCYCSPSEIDDTLQSLDWERLDFDSNGWQQDTWYWYANPNYDFQLTMEYSGFYGDLKLYRKDCDDMNIEQMDEFARKLYWEAQGYIDQANSIENKADVLREYIKAIGK